MQYVTTCKHELFQHLSELYFMSIIFFDVFLLFSSYGKPLSSDVYVIIYCIGAGKTTLMSISEGLDPYFFRRKMEKTRSMKEEMDGEVFISHQSWHLSFLVNTIKILLPICTLNWRVNNYEYEKRKYYYD